MKICIIGGTGHIGKFLVPFLVEDGHEVTVVSAGRTAVPKDSPWQHVGFRKGNYIRGDMVWSGLIQEISAEVLIDILGKDLPGTYKAARSVCCHLIACGSIWMLGPPTVVATPEITQGPCQSEGYARRYKEILSTKDLARRDGIAFTAILPPNICGPGKVPLEGRGGRDIAVHKAHMRGEPVYLPEGCNTLIGPCDASDVAQGFRLAVSNRDAAADEIFNVGSAYALTAKRFIEVYGEIYKTSIPIESVTEDEFLTQILPDRGAHGHFLQHMAPDLSKIRAKLGYEPKYTPEASMERAVSWMRKEKFL